MRSSGILSGSRLPFTTDLLTPFCYLCSSPIFSDFVTTLHRSIWSDIYTNKPRNSISRALSYITDTHTACHPLWLWELPLSEPQAPSLPRKAAQFYRVRSNRCQHARACYGSHVFLETLKAPWNQALLVLVTIHPQCPS